MQHLSTLIILENDQDSQTQVWSHIQHWPEWSNATPDHPDAHWFNWGPFAEDETPTLKIETVREVATELGYGGYRSSNQLYVINRIDTAGAPAQNALLKTVEEPPDGVRIILTATDLNAVLPTIQSRCQIVVLKANDTTASVDAAGLYQQLLTSSISEVIALVDEWGSDRPQAILRLQNLSAYLHHNLLSTQPTPVVTQHLQILTTAIEHLKKNVNVKLALDQCFFGLKAA